MAQLDAPVSRGSSMYDVDGTYEHTRMHIVQVKVSFCGVIMASDSRLGEVRVELCFGATFNHDILGRPICFKLPSGIAIDEFFWDIGTNH